MAENTTIPKLITDTDKYFQYEGSANPTTQDELQAFMKNEHSVVACLVKKLWQPETNYTQGQIVESPNMPAGFTAVALVNGTSYSNEPDWGNGSEDVSDGSMKWHLTKGNITVNNVQPDDNGNIQIDSIAHATKADNATKATNDSNGNAITDYVKSVSGDSSSITITDGAGGSKKITIDPKVSEKAFYVSGSQQGYRELWSTGNMWFNVNDYNGSQGSGNIAVLRKAFLTDSGIGAGTYSLANLLQQLVNKSHSHRTWYRQELSNCDCKCDCCSSDN